MIAIPTSRTDARRIREALSSGLQVRITLTPKDTVEPVEDIDQQTAPNDVQVEVGDELTRRYGWCCPACRVIPFADCPCRKPPTHAERT